MPLRTHTVQLDKCDYMCPYPSFERQIATKNNSNFKVNVETLLCELTSTIDNVNSLLKEL